MKVAYRKKRKNGGVCMLVYVFDAKNGVGISIKNVINSGSLTVICFIKKINPLWRG